VANLTKRTIEALKPTARDLFVWDDKLPGYGVRVKPSGIKSYVVQYRNEHNVSRRMTVGRFGVLKTDRARQSAKKILAAAQEGSDPASERSEARKAPTMADLAERQFDALLPRLLNGDLSPVNVEWGPSKSTRKQSIAMRGQKGFEDF
jgi:hypothetical protein